ncbi:MAG: RagB/SusD family nutrient uptake outer membrane protein [Gemmatimonadales bacterium]
MQQTKLLRGAGVVAAALALGACDSLLEVELPHLLTQTAIKDISTAEIQVNSAIALFECGYSADGVTALGHEGYMESIAGVFGGGYGYTVNAAGGTCDSSSTSVAWFDQMMGSRAMLVTQPSRLVPTAKGTVTSEFPVGKGVYDRIQDEWGVANVRNGERLSAIAAMYVAMNLTHFGEFLCELALDGSDLMTPPEVLALAETWVGTAQTHITNNGDFAMPFGVAPSAANLALAIRARARWADRDYAGAAADAAAVLGADPDFRAVITREAGTTRRNKIFHHSTDVGFGQLLGVHDWWVPSSRRPNPATGQLWPNPIPFTGAIFLSIMPDGRTLEAGNVPVRWAQEQRNSSGSPVSLGNGSVPDTRLPTTYKGIQGPGLHELPDVYASDDDDIPYMTWEELTLIRADRELELGAPANLTNAIGYVNAIRTTKGLPTVAGAYLTTLTDGTNDAAEVRALLFEERRRELFAEAGRFWSTKIQNTDIAWFPRAEGQTPFQRYNWQGGVRQIMPADEYEQNPYFIDRGGRASRGTGCEGLFGSQAPYFID